MRWFDDMLDTWESLLCLGSVIPWIALSVFLFLVFHNHLRYLAMYSMFSVSAQITFVRSVEDILFCSQARRTCISIRFFSLAIEFPCDVKALRSYEIWHCVHNFCFSLESTKFGANLFSWSLFFLSPRAEKHFALFGQSLVSLWSWQKRERQKKSDSVSSTWRLPVLFRHVTRPNQARSPAPEKGKIWETLGKSSAQSWKPKPGWKEIPSGINTNKFNKSN